MKFSTPKPIKVPVEWKDKLAKTNLKPDEKDDFQTIEGEICEGIEFALHLNSNQTNYRLDATIDDTINDVFHDSAGYDEGEEHPSLTLGDTVEITAGEHQYVIDIKFV